MLPDQYQRPTAAEITYRNAQGGSRTVSEGYRFDELGRVLERTAADGTVTTTTYDDTVPAGGLVPVGLPDTWSARSPRTGWCRRPGTS